ncbi:MAG: hypothetical protein DLM55_06045 [Acidimicrobiales bacterium]|nr:MAG: hypothetical protein DLM55_06045 [Acidimicrobiales bacterium]
MRRLASFAGLLAVLLAFAEITGIVLVAKWLGNSATVILLLASAVAGMWVLRYQGRRAWRVLHERDSAAHAPTAVADSLLGAIAGSLLILPGFGSSIAAGVLLLSPVRQWAARRTLRRLTRWMPDSVSERLNEPIRVRSHRGESGSVRETADRAVTEPEGEGGVAEAEHMTIIAPEPTPKRSELPKDEPPRET